MKRTVTLGLVVLAWLPAQTQKPADVEETRFFSAFREVSLSGAAEAVTIQLPAAASKRVYLQSALIYCSAACTVSQERNGSAATGTAFAAVGLNTTATPAAALYHTSNSTGGAVLPKIEVATGQQMVLDLSANLFTRGASGVQNYTVRTNAITGTARIGFIWGER